uniref:EMI domain-containing protein n=2 Tax=Monopterus albus TaxID=43700 RepID=A0A3Q3J3H4_MONAL|nr:multimerin-2 isoform X1 [Monopterus albus]
MTAVGELVLVLGLLVSAHCEVRARDPEVEEEEELGGRAEEEMGSFGIAAFPPHLERLQPVATKNPPPGQKGTFPARNGNWCAFVQKRVVTVAVVCGTEKYTIMSQSPCPSGIPDCQLVMYKLSTRPVYTQKQKIFTTLHWNCCPGHRGDNCDDTDVEAGPQQQRGDPHREQNDYQASISPLHSTTHPTHDLSHNPEHALNSHHTSQHATNMYNHRHHHRDHGQQEHRLPVVEQVVAAGDALLDPEAPAALPVHQMMALVMSQLQPVLEGFNRSLEQLSQQVGELARDMAQLKSSQQGPELQQGPPEGPELDEVTEEHVGARLDEVFQHISEVRRQMESQHTEMENRLHTQHAMLHYNFTSFKTDIDVKLKRQQKMLQASLQAMNTTLSELRPEGPEDQLEGQLPTPWAPQSSDTSVLWEAIERLDNTVVNNTVKVSGLMEDVEVASGSIQQLRRDVQNLEQQLDQAARTTQVLFMETGLEVEDAKVKVLSQLNELAGNLSVQVERLQQMDDDVDYLYTAIYRNGSSGDCDCKALRAAVVRLERGLANVTELANENRLTLDEASEGWAEQWGRASDWVLQVEALQYDLQQVKEALASEQSRTNALDHSLAQLTSSVTVALAQVSDLKETDAKLKENMQHLSASFNSLLQDAIRHSDVLELLLGEEVVDFLERPTQDQGAYSILGLQEQLRGHNLSITSLLGSRPGGREEMPSADQPPSSSHLPPPGTGSSSSGGPTREQQLLLHPEHSGDGSDLWKLEKTVEKLGLKLLQLEEKPCTCPNISTGRAAPPAGVDAKLQAEVVWLKRGLEEHLRVFKNVFSNADVLAASDATLELDKLWQLVKSKEKKRGEREATGRGENHRSRRDSSGGVHVPAGLSGASLLFVAASPLGVSNGSIVFKASLNRGQFHPDLGTFTALVDGVYLFVLTLDLKLGPTHVVLRRESGRAPLSLHGQEVTEAGPVTRVGLLLLREGEEVRLDLRGGAWVESEDNVFAGLLLHRTT